MWTRKALHRKAQNDKVRRRAAGRLNSMLNILTVTIFKKNKEVDVERYGMKKNGTARNSGR